MGSRATSKVSGSGNCAGSRLAAPMQSVIWVPAGNSRPSIAKGVAAIRLPSWFELSNRSTSSTAFRIRSGSARSRARASRRSSSSAARCRSGWWWSRAGIEDEDAVLQQFLGREPLAADLALDQPGEDVLVRVARMPAALRHEARRDRRGNAVTARLPASSTSADRTGSRAPRIASDQSRSGPRSPAARPAGCDHLDGDRGGEILDQVDGTPRLRPVEEAVHQATMPASIAATARGVSAPAMMRRTGCGARRIVEDEARRVVAVERGGPRLRPPELRPELDGLVRAEGRGVLLDRAKVGVALWQDLPVAEGVDRACARSAA